ncbi:MAG: acyl-ACP thioesterase domain-containing protein [Lawsonibacter sp.]
MSLWYEMTLPIDSRDVDGKGVCKASALLGHLQEAATQAAEHGGFSREVITQEHGAFWMLTRVWYRLERPLRWEEELTIRTWHRGGRAATLYRDYDTVCGAGAGGGVRLRLGAGPAVRPAAAAPVRDPGTGQHRRRGPVQG